MYANFTYLNLYPNGKPLAGLPIHVHILASGVCVPLVALASDNSSKVAISCSLWSLCTYVLQQAVARIIPATDTMPYFAVAMNMGLGLGCWSVVTNIFCVMFHSLQPPLSPVCVRYLRKLRCLLFMQPKQPEPVVRRIQVAPSTDIAPMDGRDIDADNLPSYGSAHPDVNILAEELEKRQKFDLAQDWKVLDMLINMITFIMCSLLIIFCVVFYEYHLA
jgi:hypothetical protein